MARFVIIDNWLDRIGGHNYQYALTVLQAAATEGWKPVLATAQAFNVADDFPAGWQIRPLFRYAWNRTHTIGVDGKRNQPIDLKGRQLLHPTAKRGFSKYFASLAGRLNIVKQRGRQRRIDAFCSACTKLFDEIGLCSEDLVFLPSVSEFDFLGLVRFLATTPSSQKIDWHVQFHYDIFDGRPPDYATQRRRKELLQQQFFNALSCIPRHRLHFYATTPQVADQYNRLQIGHFHPLPYPISDPSLGSEMSGKQKHTPLRVTMAGGIRREKGKHGLAYLIEQIHNQDQLKKKIQLWLQGKPAQISKHLSNLSANTLIQGHVDSNYENPIVVVEHPLDRNDYLTLIRRSDIAILPYNNARYQARASGVLVEMLAAQVPVIVPAGCWLAAQISDSMYEHLDNLRVSTVCQQSIVGSHWTCQPTAETEASRSNSTNIFRFGGDDQHAGMNLHIPDHASEMILSFHWEESRPGYYVRLQAKQMDANGTQLSTWETVLGQRTTTGPVSTLIHLDPHANHICLRLTNAYNNDTITMRDSEIRLLDIPPNETPSAAVGLIAADMDQIPKLLCEMERHYDHYCQTAATFAANWRKDHSPSRTVEILSTSLLQKKTAHNAA